jgi:NAD(P)H-dependent flavin oxidoreductase YrpB (nitropropane dioxygenase family)
MTEIMEATSVATTGLPSLRIGDLEARLPLVQGGMGVGISLSGLASAVANEGGVGVISTALIGVLEPDFNTNFLEANIRALRRELRKAREITDGVIGVNIMVAISNWSDMVTTAIEEGADIIFAGAGLPLDLPGYLNGSTKTKLAPIVSSARSLRVIVKRWLKYHNCLPDAVVVEGPLAGGHLGFKKPEVDDPQSALEKLVPEVIAEVRQYEEEYNKRIPVIAGGGVFTGEDIYRFLSMGAAAVQIGTRFVATYECDASEEFKQCYVDCRAEDLVIIDSPVGMPGRAIHNKFLEDVDNGIRRPIVCPYHCIKTCEIDKAPYCISVALKNAKNGRMRNALVFAGANAARIQEITSVRELIKQLFDEYEAAREVQAALEREAACEGEAAREG